MRRSRYTVEFVCGSKAVILAYSAEDARAFYSSRGGAVRGVVKGDHRFAAAAGGWELDQRALRDAAHELGLKLPITVRKNGKAGSTRATYRLRPHGHHIVVKSYLTKQQATESLWHELTHAQQAERAGGTEAAWQAVARDQRRYSYRSRPIEVEARQVATKNANKFLTR